MIHVLLRMDILSQAAGDSMPVSCAAKLHQGRVPTDESWIVYFQCSFLVLFETAV